MPTFSFDYKLADTDTDIGPPDGYFITLHGDIGEPTRFEIDSVMSNTARATLALATGASSPDEKFEIDNRRGEHDHLRSAHYTWSVARSDAQPMQQHELQLAFLLYVQERASEPVFAIPLSTLDILLAADRMLIQVLIQATQNSAPLQREVDIIDEAAATGLIELGLIAPTDVAGQYVLMDIEVR